MQMKEIKEIKTYTYDMGDGFRVDIVTDFEKSEYEAWVYHTNYGKKIQMFGVEILSTSYKELMEMAETNHYDYRGECIC